MYPYLKSSFLCRDIRNGRTYEAIYTIKNMRNVNSCTAPEWLRPILNRVEYDIETPLIVACKEGNYQVVQALLEEGAEPNKYFEKGFSPIEAVFAGNHSNEIEMIKLLVSYGADVTKYGGNTSPLFHAASKMIYTKDKNRSEQFAECVIYLLKYDTELVDGKGNSVLHYAAAANNILLVGHLIETEEHLLNHKADNGQTPLIWATKKNSLDTVSLLIAEGVDIDIMDNDGKTAYDYAITCGNEEIVELLK